MNTGVKKLISMGCAAFAFSSALLLPVAYGLSQETAPKDEARQEIDRYCTNITDKAADARYAMQTRELAQLRVDIDSRIEQLDAKRKEYEVWLKRRDEFIDKAEDSACRDHIQNASGRCRGTDGTARRRSGGCIAPEAQSARIQRDPE